MSPDVPHAKSLDTAKFADLKRIDFFFFFFFLNFHPKVIMDVTWRAAGRGGFGGV